MDLDDLQGEFRYGQAMFAWEKMRKEKRDLRDY